MNEGGPESECLFVGEWVPLVEGGFFALPRPPVNFLMVFLADEAS